VAHLFAHFQLLLVKATVSCCGDLYLVSRCFEYRIILWFDCVEKFCVISISHVAFNYLPVNFAFASMWYIPDIMKRQVRMYLKLQYQKPQLFDYCFGWLQMELLQCDCASFWKEDRCVHRQTIKSIPVKCILQGQVEWPLLHGLIMCFLDIVYTSTVITCL